MKINWKDFGITLLLLIIVSITLYSPFDFSFVLVLFLGEMLFSFSLGLFASLLIKFLFAMLPTFFASLILVFYIWRNKEASYKEVAIVSFLVPLITFTLLYLYAVIATIELPTQMTEFTVTDGGAMTAPATATIPTSVILGQYAFLIFSIILLSAIFAILGVFWKFIIRKIPIQ